MGFLGEAPDGVTAMNLDALLATHVNSLRTYLERRIPATLRSVLSADDVLQEVWLAACGALHTFEPRGAESLMRWLQTLAHAKLVDAARRARRLKRRGDPRYMRGPPARRSFADALARVPAADHTPSREVHLRETTSRILAALHELPPRQRRAIELRFVSGCSLQQIAERLGTSPKAAEHLLSRGLAGLHGLLGSAQRYFTDARSSEESPLC